MVLNITLKQVFLVPIELQQKLVKALQPYASNYTSKSHKNINFGKQIDLKQNTFSIILKTTPNFHMRKQEKQLIHKNDQILIEYNQNYPKYGRKLSQFPLCELMLKMIASVLPHNYKAVDLGCNNTSDIAVIQQICKIEGKNGSFLAVDPYSSNPNILKLTSEQFVSRQENSHLDVIIAKHAIHFNINQQQFFQNAHKRLKDNGLIFILALTRQCKLPWTKPLEQKFVNAVFRQSDIPSDLFSCQQLKQVCEVELTKKEFIDFVETRSYSNLLNNTQQEIRQCVESLRNQKAQTLKLSMVPSLLILRKKVRSQTFD